MEQRERQTPPTAVRNSNAAAPITKTPIAPHRAAAAAACASPTKVELKPYHPEILVDQRLKVSKCPRMWAQTTVSLQCKLTFATSPDDFYVRLVSPHDSENIEFSDALRKIMSEMQVYYSNVSPELSLQPLCEVGRTRSVLGYKQKCRVRLWRPCVSTTDSIEPKCCRFRWTDQTL